jgi:hypothetical protein
MTAKTAPNSSVGRNVFNGTLASGEAVAVHETMQPAGTALLTPRIVSSTRK